MNFKYFAIFVLVFIFLFCSKPLLAQTILSPEIPPIISPSPQVKAFEQFGNHSISEFTGTPNISIPLWTIKSGSIEIPLTLSYNGGGVYVDELSGLYGLKWNLNTGGVVSRSVMGNPDESYYGWLNDSNKLPDNYNNLPYSFRSEKFMIGTGCKDGMPDSYHLVTPFSCTKFTFDRNNTPTTLPFRKIFIKNTQNNINILNGWIVIDESGIYYSYNSKETTQVHTSCTASSTYKIENCPPQVDGITGWMLDTIISFNKADTIIYEYSAEGYQQQYSTNDTESIIFATCFFDRCNDLRPYSTNNSCSSYLKHNGALLKKIRTKNQNLHFIYEANSADGYGCPVVSYIKIESRLDNNTIREFSFIYKNISNRLFLDRIIEIGYINGIPTNEKLTHSFTYNETPLPQRNSYAIDRYGFYNGQSSNISLISNIDYTYQEFKRCMGNYKKPAERAGHPEFCKAGVLTSIKFPTGGKTHFEYEPNTVINENRLKHVSMSESYGFHGSDGQHNYYFEVGPYTRHFDCIAELSAGSQGTVPPSITLKDSNDLVKARWVCCNNPQQPNITELILEPGKYRVTFLSQHEEDSGFITFHASGIMNNGSGEDYGGGIRVKFITNLSENGDTLLHKEYDYNAFGTVITSGKHAQEERHPLKNIVYGISYQYTPVSIMEVDCMRPMITYNRRPDVSKIGAGYVGYTNITKKVRMKNSNIIVEKAFSFTEDYKAPVLNVVVPNTSQETKRGNMVSLIEKNSLGNPIKATFSKYTNCEFDNTRGCINSKLIHGGSVYTHINIIGGDTIIEPGEFFTNPNGSIKLKIQL